MGRKTDKRGIRSYKNPWLSCKSAFAVLRQNRARIIRLAKALVLAQEQSDREADEEKWRGIPRPKKFPATHADFVKLICGGDADKFSGWITHLAQAHLTNGKPWLIQNAKEALGAKFDDAFSVSMKLQRDRYAGDFPNAESWLLVAREFQQWERETK